MNCVNVRSSTLTVVLLFSAATIALATDTTKTCTVTYVANEGFLIKSENHKVLVDALFGGIKGNWCDQPGDSVSALMQKGSAPFDKIDLLLVTHKHWDHFNAPMILSFLTKNPKPVLICPEQVRELLRSSPGYAAVAGRIKSVRSAAPFDTVIRIGSLAVRVMRFHHGSYFETDSATGKKYDRHASVENLGYLVESDGFTFFHSGDGSTSDKDLYKAYGLGTKRIDVAFFDRTFLGREGQGIMNECLTAKNIVFMHIEPGKGEYYRSMIKSVPEMFVFTKAMERKEFAK